MSLDNTFGSDPYADIADGLFTAFSIALSLGSDPQLLSVILHA